MKPYSRGTDPLLIGVRSPTDPCTGSLDSNYIFPGMLVAGYADPIIP